MAKKHHGGGHHGGKDGINRAEMASEYGFALAFMNSSPEIKNLFNKAVKQTWTSDQFVAHLRNTKWFKHHSAAVRNAIMQKTADPATWKSNVAQMKSTVQDEWGKLFGDAPVSHKQMNKWANLAQMMGWSEAQLVDHISSSVNYSKMLTRSALGGTAAETEAQLDGLIQNFGVDLGDKWKATQVKNVIQGDGTVSGIQNQVREMAKRQYGAFTQQLDAGQTMSEIADPYVQRMADLLEMNPQNIGVKNHLVQRALTARTKDGAPAAMNLHDFSDMVRQDKRWQYTDNAKQSVYDTTSSLLRSFGLMAE